MNTKILDIKTCELLLIFQKLINDFLREPDVLSGQAFYMPSYKPRSFYDAISTTGFCVKVSEVFKERMLDKISDFKTSSRLLSITIDENLFGKCGDGAPNSWHTCIDTGTGYVIDLTCSQFGARYNNHYIWKKELWLKEFQNKNDTHIVD